MITAGLAKTATGVNAAVERTLPHPILDGVVPRLDRADEPLDVLQAVAWRNGELHWHRALNSAAPVGRRCWTLPTSTTAFAGMSAGERGWASSATSMASSDMPTGG
jgi:hypothetical protein